MSNGFSKIKFGTGLDVTDEGEGVIRVDSSGGGTGGDTTYVHTQGSPAATWSIVHGLGRYPAVDVVDTGGSVVIPSVDYVDANTITATFGSATSGKAYLN